MSEQLYDFVLKRMRESLDRFCALVPPPKSVPFADSFVYRYAEATIQQAIVQKCARCLSTLNAAFLLMRKGYVQEQAVLQRVLDEINEDITFLTFAVLRNEMTEGHRKFLDSFYEEDCDAKTGKPLEHKKPTLPRRKIHAYLAQASGDNPHSAAANMQVISKTYSGYVHAASPQTMDMFLGDPPRFQTSGVRGSYRHDEHREDLWNSFFRAILSFGFAAKALGDDALFESIRAFSLSFETQAGKDYGNR